MNQERRDSILFIFLIICVPTIIGTPIILWSNDIPAKELFNFKFDFLYKTPFIIPIALILFDCIKTKNGWKELTIHPLFLFGVFATTFLLMIFLNLIIKGLILFFEPIGAFVIGWIICVVPILIFKKIFHKKTANNTKS